MAHRTLEKYQFKMVKDGVEKEIVTLGPQPEARDSWQMARRMNWQDSPVRMLSLRNEGVIATSLVCRELANDSSITPPGDGMMVHLEGKESHGSGR
jgi:hypothetical protein